MEREKKAASAASAGLMSLKTKIWTAKYTETKVFYQSLFHLAVVDEWDDPGDVGVILAFTDDELQALLEIYHSDEARDLSGVSLQFRVESIDAFVQQIRGKVTFEGPTDRPWGSRYVYIKDPNDILVIVYEGGL
jgi:predicted enzyme related to lactoylglutathione lyase